ncbi:MAG: hypothetical protein GEV08_11640 [Acidimicrobiia bacterium]|nr:hypothetical protein [Acidimicrobiia bacterium]
MRITRVFTGEDGQSHFEDLEVPMIENPYGFISRFVPATGIAFRENLPDQFIDFHVAPRRQFVVNLTGSVSLESGTGEKRVLGPGEVLLADDTTGQGHISRDVEGPRRSLFVPVPADVDFSAWRV